MCAVRFISVFNFPYVRMVISDSFKNPADVVFVVEGTANLGGYIDVLKDNYIKPTLEYISSRNINIEEMFYL